MKEIMNNFKESMKKGIVLWVIAHLLLYVLESWTGEISIYNAQITKLYNPANFALQLIYVGLMYTALEVVFCFLIDNIFKYSVKGEKNKVTLNAILAVVIIAIVCVSIYFVKTADLVNKTILKLMVLMIVIKTMFSVVCTVRDNSVFNAKLQEKNK